MRKDDDSLVKRRKDADAAREKLLKKFADAPKADDPAVVARNAEQQARALAREARDQERERLRQEEKDRKAAEIAAAREVVAAEERARAEALAQAEAAAQAEIQSRELAAKSRVSRVIADEATRKAERDARYAARKARQR